MCRGAFPRGARGRQQYKRFFARLAPTLKETDDATGARWIDASVKLPDGRRADAFVAERFPFRPPAGWRGYTGVQRARWRLMVGRETRFARFLRARPHLERSKAATYAEFSRVEADWLAAAGKHWWPSGAPMPATKTAVNEARRALQERREIPRRGRPAGTNKLEWHPRATELFDAAYWSEQRREAADVLDYVRAIAHKEHFPAPTMHMVRQRIAAMPAPVRVRLREGAKRFTEKCVPKGHRPRRAVRGWASFDCRKADFWAQVPDGCGGVKPARLILSGCYLPFAKKWSALRFALTENFELIAATVRDAVLRDGLPRVAHTDNGGAYDALTGSPRGTAAERESFARGGIGGFFSTFNVRVLKAEPYAGWQKSIESAWNGVKRHLDKWVVSFCGGSPAERPEKLTAWLRDNADKLPTLAQAQAWATALLEFLNAKPRKSLGGLSPNLYFAQRGPTRRAVDADTIDVYLSPVVAERTCGRDGVTVDNVVYCPEPADLLHVQGQRVGVRRDPDNADVVTLCNADGGALCRAYNERLAGSGREAARLARRRAQEFRRAARKYFSVQRRRFETNTSAILKARRDFAELEEARVRAEQGEVGERQTRIVRPDLAASAKSCKMRDAQRAARRVRTGRRAVGGNADAVSAVDALLSLPAPPAVDVEPARPTQTELLARLSMRDGGGGAATWVSRLAQRGREHDERERAAQAAEEARDAEVRRKRDSYYASLDADGGRAG